MPEADVAVSATFVKGGASNKLSSLSVSRGVFTESFSGEKTSYRVNLPHIFDEPPENLSFSIGAVAENPNAEIKITAPSNAQTDLSQSEIPLVEGLTAYTVTVTLPKSPNVPPQTYTVNMSYAPDLTLGSVTVKPADTDVTNWQRTLLETEMLTSPTVLFPWPAAALAAVPHDNNLAHNPAVVIRRISGKGSLGNIVSTDGIATVTHDFTMNTVGQAVLGITIHKTVNGEAYASPEYRLTLDRDFWAIPNQGSRTFINPSKGVYYELHTFKTVGNHVLYFKDGAPAQAVTARVLVVGGGGGAGRGGYPSSGAGAGGMVEHDAFQMTDMSYAVTVGAGGLGGTGTATDKNGKNGGDSSFGTIKAYGGGASYGRLSYIANSTNYKASNMGTGKSGGSSGGGYSSAAVKPGEGGHAAQPGGYGNQGGACTNDDDYAAGGGGAGGPGSKGALKEGLSVSYGGAGRKNDITGLSVTYAAGGNTKHDAGTGVHGAANTGNGGGGTREGSGGNGGSGIVIVRLPLKIPALP
jgi:hypothetical protein